jgi:glycosyltransferase involved in cell wall biosynthesis
MTTPRISLCVIAGNEDRAIGKMLESFKDCFDELSLVMARGDTKPDETYFVASHWCRDNRKDFLAISYHNAPESEKWPHVDNFAGARNRSFENATGDWLMWADCDDVFVGDAAQLRAIIADPKTEDVHHFPYDVANAGKLTMRERLMRSEVMAGGGRWVGAVHENFRTRSTHRHKTHAAETDPTWRHEPAHDKPASPGRNLRILRGQLAETPIWLFYTHQEYYLQQNRAMAQKFGELFLAIGGTDDSFRYQANLNLSAIAEKHADASRYALAAYWIFPYREALAALVNCAFQECNPVKAMHFAQALVDTDVPHEKPWCHEPRWYGWHGDDLFCRAYRLMYGDKDGDQNRMDEFDPNILLVHETTEATAGSVQLRDAWMSTAKHPDWIWHAFKLPDAEVDSKWFKSFERFKASEESEYIRKIATWLMKTPRIVRIDETTPAPKMGWDVEQ